jgi:hypothetical protein
LIITSAEKRSGKTRLLDVLELLVRRVWRALLASEAVLFRKIAKDCPTLLFDELDAIYGSRARSSDGEPIRAVVNAGNRRGTRVPRCVGEGKNMRIEEFDVFCPKALAGIGTFPDTITDRGIPLRLERKAPDESVARFRYAPAKVEAEPVRAALEAWAATAVDELRAARPEIPETLDDRAADGWEPLLAIADMAGRDWPERARAAALALHTGIEAEDESERVQLLRDLQSIYDESGTDRLATAVILEKLNAMEDRPWCEWYGHGKPLTPRGLASLLRPFGKKVRSKNIKLADGSVAKGYTRDVLEKLWYRYTSPASVATATSATDPPGNGLHENSFRYGSGGLNDISHCEVREVAAVADKPLRGGNGGVDASPGRAR